LILREATGFERLILLFITKRRYRCRDCQSSFRAADRRVAARAAMDIETTGVSIPGRLDQ
jgi:transposase